MNFIESETLELKKSTSELKEAVISICAMLNKHGQGTLWFGIADDGAVIGQQLGKNTLKDIIKALADHLEPKIFPQVTAEKIGGRNCIRVEFSGKDGLYCAYGRFYLRVGEEDRKLSVNEIRRLVRKLDNYAYPWGAELSDQTEKDVSTATIKDFVRKGRKAGRINFPYDTAANVLRKLGLLAGNRLLNAGKALFSRREPLTVQAAIFAGTDKLTFLDIQNYQGNILELAARAELYVQEHIRWRADLSGSTRVEIPEIPVRALKEAITNSLCHRDFSNPKSNEVAIYKDRIEIYNPGHFPEEYSPEDFIKGGEASIPRNPLVAEALFRSEDIEKWGSGLRRISRECRAAGIKLEFRRAKSGFFATFWRPAIDSAEEAVPGVAVAGQKGSQKSSQKSSQKILEMLAGRKEITILELAEALGISDRAVKKHLRNLTQKGAIRRIGPDKGGHWEVVQK